MNAVLDVVKKYFNEVYNTSNHYYGRRPSNDRIFNMALTSDQISEAHDTLSKIKDLIKKIKVLEKKNKDTNEIYDKIIDLNN
jgi:molybdopterin synthase catalytic subunit